MKSSMKDIPSFEGLYAVTSDGRVWSYPNRLHEGKWLKAALRKGYRFVSLCKGNKLVNSPIHRLVAKAFLANLKNYPILNHKDGNKENNNFSNLEWCTHQHNVVHMYETIGMPLTEKKTISSRKNVKIAQQANRKLSWEKVCKIRESYSSGISGLRLSVIHNLSASSVYDIIRNRTYKENYQ